MKKMKQKLSLNKMTIDILDDKALLSIKGGKNTLQDDSCTSCGLISNGCVTCNTNKTQ